VKNLTWQNPEQLFVAQELINKVKSKCCGIKDNVRAIDADFLAGFIMTGMKDDASRDIFLSDVHLQ